MPGIRTTDALWCAAFAVIWCLGLAPLGGFVLITGNPKSLVYGRDSNVRTFTSCTAEHGIRHTLNPQYPSTYKYYMTVPLMRLLLRT